MFRYDRNRHGGGVLVFVKSNIEVISVKNNQEHEIIELVLKLVDGEKIALLACYRPPNYETRPCFLETLSDLFFKYLDTTSDILIVGDLNYDMLDDSNLLSGFCTTNGFTNTISKGTRLNILTLA